MLRIGRIAYAVAILGMGVLCLAYVDTVNQLQPIPSSLPGYWLSAILTGAILIAAGVAIIADTRVFVAATVLAVVFALWIVFLQVPSAFINPSLLRSPWWVRTFETMAMTGAAGILAGVASDPVRESWIRRGRITYGISLPVFGVLHFIYPESVAGLIPPWYPFPMFWAYFTGLGHFAAGVAIATGVLPRLAATLAGVMYGSWALTLHIPRSACRAFVPCSFMDDPVGLQQSRGGLTSLFIAFAMWGGAWIVAGTLAKRKDAVAEEHSTAPAV